MYDGAQPKFANSILLAVELTSKSTRYADVNEGPKLPSKYREYQRIGVRYFVIIDVSRQPMYAPPVFWGHQLVGKRYHPIQPDQHGRLWLPQVGVALGAHDMSVAWFDPHGNRLLSLEEETVRANQAEARAEQEAQAHQKEKARANQEAQAR